MKLCEFERVNACVHTYYCIKNGDDVIDSFTVDYLDSRQDRFDESILKLESYNQATIITVSGMYSVHGLYVIARI